MHFRSRSVLALIVSFALGAAAQTTPTTQNTQTTQAKAFVLLDGTPIKLRLTRNVSSADAHVGDNVDFEVLEEVKVNDVIVISKGGTAIGTVTEAQPKRRMARGGKVDLTIDYARLLDDEKAALRAVKEAKGGGHTGAMTAGIVATGLLLWPAAPFFLFMHGKDITIPKGAEITAYVNGNMPLEISKFQPKSNVVGTPSTQLPAVSADMDFSSTPTGADIEVDGNFVGTTPSTIGVASGQHTITVKKSGYNAWERKMTVSSGHVKIDATLEASTN
jgi:hypothetical protein